MHSKASAALDAASASQDTAGYATSAPSTTFSGSQQKINNNRHSRAFNQTIRRANYEKATFTFLRLGNARGWLAGSSPLGISQYTGLYALHRLYTITISNQGVGSGELDFWGVYRAGAVCPRIEAYVGSHFTSVLELLSRYSTRHYVDIHPLVRNMA
ncbi:hypothetical protein PILCRDRAFT_453917 [Piloderma croceum F 1598]|uniref:Uncharacterized protein n=1 Tax=Piloderma croceum (strain F 1598) TaxID=765440 RepID=A0A0C3FSP1_PILCF|nr:hypothetical protein PILCRDRAFT_453917 [Piloderma croceum F 1598]